MPEFDPSMIMSMIAMALTSARQSQTGNQPQSGNWTPRISPMMPHMGAGLGGDIGMMAQIAGMAVPQLQPLVQRLQANANVNPMNLRLQREFETVNAQMTSMSQGAPLAKALGMKPGDTGYDMVVQGGPVVGQLLQMTGAMNAIAPHMLVQGGQSLMQTSMRMHGEGRATHTGSTAMLEAFRKEYFLENDRFDFTKSGGLSADDAASTMLVAADFGVRGELNATDTEAAKTRGRDRERKRRQDINRGLGLGDILTKRDEDAITEAGTTEVDAAKLIRGANERLMPVKSALRDAMPDASDSELNQLLSEMVPKTKEQMEATTELIRRSAELGKAFGMGAEQIVQATKAIQSETGAKAQVAREQALQVAGLQRHLADQGFSTGDIKTITDRTVGMQRDVGAGPAWQAVTKAMRSGDAALIKEATEAVQQGESGILAFSEKMAKSQHAAMGMVITNDDVQATLRDFNGKTFKDAQGKEQRIDVAGINARMPLTELAEKDASLAPIIAKLRNDPDAMLRAAQGLYSAEDQTVLQNRTDVQQLLRDAAGLEVAQREKGRGEERTARIVEHGKILKDIQNQERTGRQGSVVEAMGKLFNGGKGVIGNVGEALQSVGMMSQNHVDAMGNALETHIFKDEADKQRMIAAAQKRFDAFHEMRNNKNLNDKEKAALREQYYNATDVLTEYNVDSEDKSTSDVMGPRPVKVDGAAPATATPAAGSAAAQPPVKVESQSTVAITLKHEDGRDVELTNVTGESRANQGAHSTYVQGKQVK